jgi:hypothetical protein
MSGNAVLQEMFCHIVDKDSMPHSCAAVPLDETIKIGELANNPYYSFNYDMLATAAYEKQLFGFQKKNATGTQVLLCQQVADLVQQYQEDMLNLMHHDFATNCLEQDKLDHILNASITSERVIYGVDNWTSQHEDNLLQAFLTYQKKTSLYLLLDQYRSNLARSHVAYLL